MFKTSVIGNLAILHLLTICCLLFQWVHISDGSVLSRRYPERIRVPCEDPEPLENGLSVSKRRNTMLQHYCNYGFKLIGDRRTQCNRGKWNGDRPICAKPGCTVLPDKPEQGNLQYIDQYHIGLYCSEGYDLFGNRYAYCNGSNWDRPLGGCRKPGCTVLPDRPKHGNLQRINQYHIGLYCPEGYNLFGNRYAYCDGSNWDRPLGGCRMHSSTVSHECDFESSDVCGWTSEMSEYFKWRRVTAADVFTSFHTGPRHDHTTMTATGGHYMVMESFGATSTPVALSSPIYGRDVSLMTASCFQFYYFMYGAGVGNLNVYVKPVTKMLMEVLQDKENYVKFTKSGNQNNNWNEAHFSIDDMEDDFQIVFVADGAKNHLSDIAIDDVKIMTGSECKALDHPDEEPDDSAEYEMTTTEESLYDTLSCVARCGQDSNMGIMREATHLIGVCSCHDSCVADNDCCPDYVKVCLNALNVDQFSTMYASPTTTKTNIPLATSSATETNETTSPTPTTTTTTIPTTTPKPTTIKIKTSSTSTTTTTTTRKPTTTTTTTTRKPATTTATTRKPTTTSTSTSTTTTRKPVIKITTTSTSPSTTKTTRRSTLATTKRTTPKTTTTKRATPTTITKKSVTPTTTSLKTTTTTKRSTASSTTKTLVSTQPILEVSTGATIDRKPATDDTMEMSRKEINQTQIKASKAKHTWKWQPQPETNPRGAIALFLIFGLLLFAVIATVLYRRRGQLKTILERKILQKNPNGEGAEDSNSIIANFRHEDAMQNCSNAASGSTASNQLKLSLPSLKKSKPDKRGSSGEHSLCAENDDDDIPLL